MILRLYVEHLIQDEILTLEQLHKNHLKPAARRPAHIILLNNQGLSSPPNCLRNLKICAYDYARFREKAGMMFYYLNVQTD